MKRLLQVLTLTGLLTSGTALRAQSNPDVTHARVKQLTAGKTIVLDVDNAVDKSYDLSKTDPNVKVSSGLKVGDPVKITERMVNGKKTVDISHDSEDNAKHGDKSRTEEKRNK